MFNIIVPLDFSEPSLNAARYAANMYHGRSDVKIILYHFYSKGENITTAKELLNAKKDELSLLVNNIETELESGDYFIDCLAEYAHVTDAFMIVMGLNGNSPKLQRFSGTNTLSLSERGVCPILTVPVDAVYTGIANALISSELKGVEDTPSLLAVKRVLCQIKPLPMLHILNVNAEHYISLNENFKTERDKMENLLIDFKPEFYFMRLFDFHESVNEFVKNKDINLIIIAPKYHNFFERLFKTQHTRKLIYQTSVPVLVIHD